MLEGGENRQT